jgi:hypothetical protein
MLRSCINCKAEASLDLQLLYCATCKSASYCSKACQREDWEKQHSQICKHLLNVGHGDMQVRTPIHTTRSNESREAFESRQHGLDEDMKGFFKLFQESMFEGSRAAALEMTKIAECQTKNNLTFLLFHSLSVLARSDLKMLSWPNSPLLVLLQFVDPSVLSGHEYGPSRGGENGVTPLHDLADLADPSDYSTHKKQLILAKQLIEHGANVNAVSYPQGDTPLHHACFAGVVTNLDFVEFLLKEGADPNCQDDLGLTPLMFTRMLAPGAAKVLLDWATTDVDITNRSGLSFLATVRMDVKYASEKIALPDCSDRVLYEFWLQQWREIQEILVERGATDAGITALE